MGSDYQDIKPIEIEDQRSASEKEHSRQLEELDTFFTQLDPSLRLMVWRLQPAWCRGCLEEIYVANAREDINLQYFIKHWGGQLLQIRVRGKRGTIEKSYTIPLYSYPPLVKGNRITEEDLEKPAKPVEPPIAQQTNPVIMNQSSTNMDKIFELIPAIFPLWSEYVKHQESRRREDMAMMIQMMKSQGGGISDITKIGAVMTQLNQMFRQNNPDMSDSGELGFMTQALDVIKSVMNRPPQSSQVPEITGHRLTGPKGLPKGNVPKDTDGKVTPIKPTQTEPDYAKSIADMDAHNAAGTIISAFGNMPENKREEAIGYIMDEYQKMHPEMFVDDDLEVTGEQRGRK